MRHTRKLTAGLLDAALSSLGTFAAGVVAVRQLDTAVLGLYAVLFSVTVLAMLLPRQLHYVPAQLAANLLPDLTAPQIARDARRGAPATLLTFVVVLATGLSLIGKVPWSACLALTLTAAGYAVVSPLQDHLRSSLHLVERHFSAAICSGVLACTVGVVAVAALLGTPGPSVELAPFGSLLVGNVLSIGVGGLLLRGVDRHTGYLPQPFRIRSRLLVAEAGIQAAWFGCNYGILLLLGAATLGRLEAARILSSPIYILSTALLTFMAPAMLRKVAPDGGRRSIRNDVVGVLGTLLGAAALYLAALAMLGQEVSRVLGKAVELPLVAARSIAGVAEGSSGIIGFLTFALGRTRLALGLSVTAGVIGFGGTLLLAPLIGLYALPVAQAAGMTARLVASLVTVARTPRVAVAAA